MVNSIKGKSMKNHSPDIMKLAPLMNLDEVDLYFLTNCNHNFQNGKYKELFQIFKIQQSSKDIFKQDLEFLSDLVVDGNPLTDFKIHIGICCKDFNLKI